MNPSDILLLGLKKRVAAIERASGRILWETKLKGGQGDFVTLLCDGPWIYAAAGGHLHCLHFHTGEVLWTNNLPGYGFGLASLCLPDSGLTAPTSTAVERLLEEQRAATQAATTPAVTTS
jgi:outer membrane protein assembly factor BamB